MLSERLGSFECLDIDLWFGVCVCVRLFATLRLKFIRRGPRPCGRSKRVAVDGVAAKYRHPHTANVCRCRYALAALAFKSAYTVFDSGICAVNGQFSSIYFWFHLYITSNGTRKKKKLDGHANRRKTKRSELNPTVVKLLSVFVSKSGTRPQPQQTSGGVECKVENEIKHDVISSFPTRFRLILSSLFS